MKQLDEQAVRPQHLNGDELNTHAAEAMKSFKKAIELSPKNALYHLGLASLLEQYVTFLTETKDVPPELANIILERASDVYYEAYSLSIRIDENREYLPAEGWAGLVSHEASEAYLRTSSIARPTDVNEVSRRAVVANRMDMFKRRLRFGPITPIIFAMDAAPRCSDLLASDIDVRFDPDGDGLVEA